MRVGVLGTGVVGQTLGSAFLELGHEVCLGAREATNEKAREWAHNAGKSACNGTFAEAATFGDIVVLATLGAANDSVIAAAGADAIGAKLVLDTTNPLDFSTGFPPTLSRAGTDSGGEQVQRLLPAAKVVKVFNTVGAPQMFRPQYAEGRPDMFIAGNDDAAKKQVSELLDAFGWGTIDVGDIRSSRYLEAMCMVWVLHGAKSGGWTHAYKMLHR